MAYRWFVGEMITGRKMLELPVMTGSTWLRQLNQPDTLHAVVSAADPDAIALALFGSAAPGKAFLAVSYDDVVLAAGPIWSLQYIKNTRTLNIDAQGLYSYFEHRTLLPASAATLGPKGQDSTWNDISLGTIAKRIVQQSETWPGGGIPIIYPDDIADSGRTRTYLGSDVAYIAERLNQLSEVEDGPDIDFMPRYQSDRLGVEWVMRVGTPTQPDLYGNSTMVFNASVPDSTVKDIEIVIAGSQLASQAWSTAGKATDDVLIARGYISTLIDLGWPLLEYVDSNHADLVDTNTLQGYANALAINGLFPVQTMSFMARTDMAPALGSYNIGDYVTLRVSGDEFLPDGDYTQRVVSISGDAEGRWVKIATQPNRS